LRKKEIPGLFPSLIWQQIAEVILHFLLFFTLILSAPQNICPSYCPHSPSIMAAHSVQLTTTSAFAETLEQVVQNLSDYPSIPDPHYYVGARQHEIELFDFESLLSKHFGCPTKLKHTQSVLDIQDCDWDFLEDNTKKVVHCSAAFAPLSAESLIFKSDQSDKEIWQSGKIREILVSTDRTLQPGG
jgi:hypothetical protein